MPTLKRLQFKNFFSYSNQLTTIDLKNGMYLINGKNGSGKSVLLDAIYYCWYGKTLRPDIKNSETVNRINKKNMYVKSLFNVNNDEYSVIRGLKPTIFQIWKNGEKLEEYNKTDMQKYLEDNILKLNEKIFKQIVILGSDLHTPFLKLSLPDRRFLIEKLFDFDTLRRIKDIAKGQYKERENKLNELKNKNNIVCTRIDSLKGEKKRIDSENKRIKELRERGIEQLNNEIVKLINEIEDLKSKLDDNIGENEKSRYEEKIYEIGIKLNDLNNKSNERILKLDRVFNEKILTLNNEIVEIENDIEKLNREIKEKKKVVEDKSYCIVENDLLKDEKSYLRTNETGWEKIELYRRDEFEIINRKINEIDLEIERTKKRINYYRENDSCEICGTIFTKVKKRSIIEDLKLDIKKLKEERKKHEIKLNELNNNKNAVEKKLKEAIGKNKSNIKEIENDIQIENDEKEKIILNEIKELEKKREEIGLGSLATNKEIELLQSEKRELEKEIRNKYENEYDKLLNIKNEMIREKRNYEKKLQEQNELKNNIKIEYIKMGNLKERIKAQKKIQLVSIDEVNRNLLKYRSYYAKISKEVSKREKYLEYLEKVIDIFSDKGIRSVLIQKYLPLLNSKMHDFLNEFNCDFNIEFDQNFDTIIRNRDKEISYGTFSSGQRQRMNLAILFTFMSFMKLKQGVNCNLLIFDEILDSSLDEEGIEIFFRLLSGYSAKEKYSIFVISHRESNVNYFSNVYKVEMRNKFSRIEKIVV